MSDSHDDPRAEAPQARRVPFGLQFAETCRPPTAPPPLTYDETSDLTLTHLAGGGMVPYVALAAAGATQTFTKVVAEATDSDVQAQALAATKTITEVRTEQSDTDASADESLLLGTRTETLVASEASDADPSPRRAPQHKRDGDVDWLVDRGHRSFRC